MINVEEGVGGMFVESKDSIKVVMIFVDAFSSRYVNEKYCPFLFKILQSNGEYKLIEPLFAFEGIGTTIFTGTWPESHGVWTSFIRVDRPRYQISNLILSISTKLSEIIPNDRLAWDLRYLTYKLLGKPVPIPHLIPSNLLKYFQHIPWYFFTQKNKILTLFDVVKKHERTIANLNVSSILGDKMVVERTIKYFRSKKIADLTYLKLSKLDLIGHKYGPKSNQIKSCVKILDSVLQKIIKGISDISNVIFLVFSDHGMVPVRNWINIAQLLDRTSLKTGRDFLFFLDSTMVRFWFSKEKARNIIESMLSNIKCGRFISRSELKKLRLPTNDYYGELIFVLDEHNVIHPDFFHRHEPVKGMHGYYKSSYDNPILIIYPPDNFRISTNKYLRFVDIAPTVLDLLEIPHHQCEGKSIIRG